MSELSLMMIIYFIVILLIVGGSMTVILLVAKTMTRGAERIANDIVRKKEAREIELDVNKDKQMRDIVEYVRYELNKK